MEKIIEVTGRVDTTNYEEIEKNINSQIENFNGDIILDLKKLEYISSAGLRTIMRLKKRNDSTKIINCNLEIYNIFQMTGFTKIMDISKELREISIDGCELIGDGFYGTVYRIDPETIVKVYKEGTLIEKLENEIEVSRKAFVLGIPTAIPYDIVKVGNLYGTVFELINSSSLQKLIVEGTDIDKLVKETVDVLKIIHSTELEKGELPSKKDEKIECAKYCSKLLPKSVGDKLVSLVENIKEVNTMLHGDYHIKNIMKQNDEIILIDMDTLSLGHPIFELAAIFATYVGFSSVDNDNAKAFLGISYEQSIEIFELTYKYYFNDKDEKYINDIKEKAKILGYMQILFLRSNFMDSNNPVHIKDIEFAKNYIIENIDKVTTLDF